MRSAGQEWAIKQLEEVAQSAAGGFEILEIVEPVEEGAMIGVLVSIDCRSFPKKSGGVPLRSRERIRVTVPPSFPLTVPLADFTHDRYAGHPHVQWGHHMCLYQAPETEWDPSRGVVGFLQRLDEWLRAAAAGELDPVGMPLHPPVAYSSANFFVIPQCDTPVPQPPFWSGYARITASGDHVAELGEWVAHGGGAPEGPVATAILLPTTMPFEYPATMFDLLKALVQRGVPVDLLHVIIELGALSTPKGSPSLFVLGAAMRGTAGGERLQHLACWQIDSDQTDLLRAAAMAATPDNPIDVNAFYAWATNATVQWVRVLEERPQIVERRDGAAPASWWHGRHVAILGCGAIGSAVAMMLARAGVAKLDLYDNAIVTPGILVRQNFRRKSIGYGKAGALQTDVRLGVPAVEVTAYFGDVKRAFAKEEEMARLLAADVIIDATAASSVGIALEHHFRHQHTTHPQVITMALGHNADLAMMTASDQSSTGLSFDLDRKSKIAFSNSSKGADFLEEFWPLAASRRKPFQPEPGCSSPTFRGSYTDVLSLVSRMTNVAAGWLAKGEASSRAFAMNLSGGGIATRAAREIELKFEPDSLIPDSMHGYQIHLSRDAKAALLSWIRQSERTRESRTETGGVLFGQVDEFLKVIWIDEVSGPPPDSKASPSGFVCGTAGVAQVHAEKERRTRGSVGFVGMWHTHPKDLPIPSTTDLGAMEKLLAPGTEFVGRRFLMMIVGGTAKMPIPAAYVFERADYAR